MADRNLTQQEWKDFWRLPMEEKIEQCKKFSAHDSFRLRITDPGISASQPWIPCNSCVYRVEGKAACEAYPKGIPAEHIRAVMENQAVDCGSGLRYAPGEQLIGMADEKDSE